MTPSQANRQKTPNRKRAPKESYDRNSYARAIRRACKKAGIDPWTPNQLRHSRATMLRAEFGIEAAQLMLGHSNPDTTLVYAEAQFDKARDIAKATG